MFQLSSSSPAAKPEAYAEIATQLRGLLHGERDYIANAANLAALLWHTPLPSSIRTQAGLP